MIRQLQDETWRIIRYTRHQMLGVDRRARLALGLKIESRKEEAKRKEALAKTSAEKTGQPVTELSALLKLSKNALSSIDEVDAILDLKPTEIEENKALEAGIVFQEQLERLINSCFRRRNETLQQLEIYRAGLGQQWKDVSDQIIDAEVTEVEEQRQLAGAPPCPQDPALDGSQHEDAGATEAPDRRSPIATTPTEQ